MQRLLRAFQRKTGHAVGVRVVVHALMIFIRPYDVVQLIPVGVKRQHHAGNIEFCAGERHARPTFGQYGIIPRILHIAHQCPNHGRRNVNLLIFKIGTHWTPGEYIRHVIIRTGVKAALLAFPRVKRALIAIGGRLFERTGKRLDAVAYERTRDFRLRIQKIIQQK